MEYHQAVLHAMDDSLLPSAGNAELKALLLRARASVAAHLDEAKALQKALDGT